MQNRSPFSTVLLAVALSCSAIAPAAALPLQIVRGYVVDVRNGLPVPDARVRLLSGPTIVARAKTSSSGEFVMRRVKPGTYQLSIQAEGFQRVHLTGFVVAAAGAQATFRMALSPARGMATIAHVSSASKALQRTSTVSESVNAATLQQQDILRIGDLLGTLPGVTAAASSSSFGDDETISIRGFDPTETATLLDGHPIGPIGASGAGFNYAVSPFWGLRESTVTFGSGATGLYGVSTIAGAVNFDTLDPTLRPNAQFQQGVGNDGQLFSGIKATGTSGRVGYAIAAAVQGTTGMYPSQRVLQQGLLGADANGFPNVTAANVAANTYPVSGAYVLRNDLVKATYQIDPLTSIEGTAFVATSWVDHTGNGDNDYNPYPYNLYEYQQGLASNPITHVRLPDGKKGKCRNSIAFLNDSPAEYGCYTASQAARMTAGPAGGGPNSFTANRNQDYHLRLTRRLGRTQLFLDGFVDSYATDDFSPPSAAIGGFTSDIFRTHGFLARDAISLSKHDLSYGVYLQHQAHTGDSFNQATDIFGNPLVGLVPNPEFDLSSTSYFVSDQWRPNERFSTFSDLWFQHSNDTRVTNFDPRLAFLYRPSNADTVRLSAGHSYSEPDPSLLYAPPSLNSDVSGFNPVCGASAVNSIGSTSDSKLVPETATDTDLSFAHRFAPGTDLQADAYQATEWNALMGGALPLSQTGFTQIPARIVDGYLRKIQASCHNNPTINDLYVSTTYNAAQERYRGIVLAVNARPMRGLELRADYNVQSAAFYDLSQSLMMNNATLIDGQQTAQAPLHTADVGFTATRRPFQLTFDSHYIGAGNWLDRGAFWYADASIAARFRPVTITLGVNNVFNSAAADYGYIGLGTFQPENQYGGDNNSFDQGSELFGLPYRSFRVMFSFDRS